MAALAVLAGFLPAQAAKPGQSVQLLAKTTLAQARQTLLKMQSGDAFAAKLRELSFALPLQESVSLCREFLPRNCAGRYFDLWRHAAALATMASRFEDAAFFHLQGGQGKPEAIAAAGRCYLAAGKPDAALKCAESLAAAASASGSSPAAADPAATAASTGYANARKDLLLAWWHYLAGDNEKSYNAARDASAAKDRTFASEAFFVMWLAAHGEASSSGKASGDRMDAASVLAALGRNCAESPEAALAAGKVLPMPSSWILAGMPSFSAPEGSARKSLARDEGVKQASSPQTGQARLQAGWFSKKENATGLAATLAKNGIAARVEEQSSPDGEPRWAVIVDAGGDWSKMQAKLKDLGYESYLLP